jgi:hypothetical protein
MHRREVETDGAVVVDEQLPLLPTGNDGKPTPLPRLQFTILLLMLFAEPITAQCILPFINEVRP